MIKKSKALQTTSKIQMIRYGKLYKIYGSANNVIMHEIFINSKVLQTMK